MKKPSFLKQFNWRALLVRILINAVVLAVTALILPNINFVKVTIGNILFIAIALGILNALVKPILQFLTLSFIFTTYGLVVVVINAILLWFLAVLFPDRFAVSSILGALIGGALIGIFGSFFESLFGLSPPIVPDEHDDESRLQQADSTPVVTKMILKKGEEDEPKLADPAVPLHAGLENGLQVEAPVQPDDEESLAEEPVDRVSQPAPPDALLETEEPGDEQEIAEDSPSTEEEPIAPDTENGETPVLPAATDDDDQSDTQAPAEENESWQ